MTDMCKKVAAVVVTYNRKELLIRCLDAIKAQVRNPDILFIIDNLSDDGTPQLLLENKLIPKLPSDKPISNETIETKIDTDSGAMKLTYIRKSKNDGGAGGFYEGLKRAFDTKADWIWLMDDDGVPEENQLDYLIANASTNFIDFANALVINEKKKEWLAFGLGDYKKVAEIDKDNIIYDLANPFNGTLLTRELVSKIGFIKKEMFIWGDETEYMSKTAYNNFKVATIPSAIHYHPESKTNFEGIFPFALTPKVEIKLESRKSIFYRNKAFNISTYNGFKATLWLFIKYNVYYISRLKPKGLIVFLKAFRKGITNNFNGDN